MRTDSGRFAPQLRHRPAIDEIVACRPAPRVAVKRRNGASVIPDIGARMTRLATLISPIFNGLGLKPSGPVTAFSFLWQPPYRDYHAF
jgi:hypothetical protein